MLKTLDRYIIKKFLGTFIFSIILIISLAIVIDLSQKIDSFIEKQIPLQEIIFNIILISFPIIQIFSFFFLFLSVLFFLLQKWLTNLK